MGFNLKLFIFNTLPHYITLIFLSWLTKIKQKYIFIGN